MPSEEQEFYKTVGTNTVIGYASVGEGFDEENKTNEIISKNISENNNGSSRWGVLENKRFYGVQTSTNKLLPGIYGCDRHSSLGWYFIKKKNETDSLVTLPDSASAEIIDEITEFHKIRTKFKKLGFLYKRGILLWGPPGSGKTTTIQLLIKKVITEMNGVAVYVASPRIAAGCLELLRDIEPSRQVIMIMEDLDSLVTEYGDAGFLSLLDGETQIDNIIFIATTNYPEKLDKRFVDRPSRFDTVKFIGMPNSASREKYLISKDPTLTNNELKLFVEKTRGFSVAHLRELIILTRVFGRNLEESIAKLELMTSRHPTSDDDPSKNKIGFSGLSK